MKKFNLLKSSSQILMFCSILFLFISAGQASAQTIERLDDLLEKKSAEITYIQNLFTKQYSTLTVEGSSIETNGNGSFIVLKTNISDLNVLYNENPLFREVELIQIEVSNPAGLNNSLDVNQLTGFSNLLVVNFLFTYDACGESSDACLKNEIQDMIQGNDEIPAFITYKLSLPN